MAIKISALTSYTTPLAADIIPIVDVANTLTKQVTWANLFRAPAILAPATLSVGQTTSAQTDLLVNPTTKASGNLIDLQVNSVSKFLVNSVGLVTIQSSSVNSTGLTSAAAQNLYLGSAGTTLVAIGIANGIQLLSTAEIAFSSSSINSASDVRLTRSAAATLQFGALDAASPIAQTLKAQSVATGTSNTAGLDWTRKASQGTGTGIGGDHVWQVAPAGTTGTAQNAFVEAFRVKNTGALIIPQTITTGGTTGNQTINKVAGTVNIAAAGSSVTVTNSLVTTSSTIYCSIRTNDTTALIKNVVPGAGSFVILLNANCTAETSIGFLVIN